jgi:hypothetical protein
MIRGLREALPHGPVYVARFTKQKAYEWRHPDEPWLTQDAIRFLDAELPRDGMGLEWGSGRSTRWLSQRLAHLTSIEMNEDWYRRVKAQVEGNVDLRHIPVTKGEKDPPYVAVAGEFPDRSLDFVLVDGHYRPGCINAIPPKLKTGALLAVDNTNWLPMDDWGVPGWPIVHQSSNVRAQTTVWRAT